jgi:hypothetical protein
MSRITVWARVQAWLGQFPGIVFVAVASLLESP